MAENKESLSDDEREFLMQQFKEDADAIEKTEESKNTGGIEKTDESENIDESIDFSDNDDIDLSSFFGDDDESEEPRDLEKYEEFSEPEQTADFDFDEEKENIHEPDGYSASDNLAKADIADGGDNKESIIDSIKKSHEKSKRKIIEITNIKKRLVEIFDKIRPPSFKKSSHSKNYFLADINYSLQNVSKKILFFITGGIGFLVLVMAIILVISINNYRNPPPAPIVNADNIIRSSQDTKSTIGYTFLRDEKSIDEKKVTLTKFIADKQKTIFYMHTELDFTQYIITLFDTDGREYKPDLFYEDTVSQGYEKILRFEPLQLSSDAYILFIGNKHTNESIEFSIGFDKEYEFPDTRFLTAPITVESSNPSITVGVEAAEFSSSMSKIYFSLNWTDKVNVALDNNRANNIYLTQQSKKIYPYKSDIDYMEIDGHNTMISRMDFEPLMTLSGKANFTIDKLYKNFKLNEIIKCADLFENLPEKQITISFSHYELTFERMAVSNGEGILVAHCIDTDIILPEHAPNSMANRVEVHLDAELIINTPSGETEQIPGVYHAVQAGTDIVFDVTDIIDIVRSSTPEDYSIIIKGAEIKLDDIKFSIDLNKMSIEPPIEYIGFTNAIETYFGSRLMYKANEADLNEVKGFRQTILQNEKLMRNYEPYADLSEYDYSVEVISYKTINDTVYAVVYEKWTGVKDKMEIDFFKKHMISVTKTSGEWLILSDIILE